MTVTAVLDGVVALRSWATGAWLASTVIDTVAVFESAKPSLRRQVNESGPV